MSMLPPLIIVIDLLALVAVGFRIAGKGPDWVPSLLIVLALLLLSWPK